MQVTTSITLTVLHDGQFWIGIFEHADEGRYGACRVVFGAAEPTDVELVAFIVRRWTTLAFDMAADPSATADAMLSHANPKRRQREARKLVERAGVGTKAQQAMSVSYEARKIESRALAREARQAQAERRFALRRQNEAEASRKVEARNPHSPLMLCVACRFPRCDARGHAKGRALAVVLRPYPVYIRGNIFHARYLKANRPKRARTKGG